jgi:hypothetical protein
VLDEPLGDDDRHELVGIVDPLPALKTQREGECVGDVDGGGGRFRTNPRIREAMTAGFILPVTPAKPAAEPLLTLEEAKLVVDIEEYERCLCEVGNA